MANPGTVPDKKNRGLILIIAIAISFLILVNVMAIYLLRVEHTLRQEEKKAHAQDTMFVK
jgi:hypothetical protein